MSPTLPIVAEQCGIRAIGFKSAAFRSVRRGEPEMGRDCRNLVKFTPFRQVPIAEPEAEPQGNAMLSVRIAAVGAVVATCSFLTAPASACDFDRYQKKCDRELAARAQADTATVERKSAKRVKVVSSRRARQLAKRVRSAPRFAVKQREDGMKLASADARAVLLPESALARRFRGFISPKPLADNAFEILRKPHVVALDFDAAAIVTSTAPTDAAPSMSAEAAPAPAVVASAAAVLSAAAPAITTTPKPAVNTTPKQDKIAAKPAAAMELAAAESKPATLAPLASRPAAEPPVAPAMVQASLTEAPFETPQPNRFSIHSLVLALCGALGAASALRFIVGA